MAVRANLGQSVSGCHPPQLDTVNWLHGLVWKNLIWNVWQSFASFSLLSRIQMECWVFESLLVNFLCDCAGRRTDTMMAPMCPGPGGHPLKLQKHNAPCYKCDHRIFDNKGTCCQLSWRKTWKWEWSIFWLHRKVCFVLPRFAFEPVCLSWCFSFVEVRLRRAEVTAKVTILPTIWFHLWVMANGWSFSCNIF